MHWTTRGFFASRLAALVLCLLGGLSASQWASAQTLASDWQGMYYYPSSDKRAPVPFSLRLNVSGPSFTGRTSEPATFGNGTSSQLFANVAGTISGTTVTFVKTYDGTGGVNHSVQYSGSISADGRTMSGGWHIGNFGGRFSATALNAAPASCLIPDKVFPRGVSPNTVIWHFGNACGVARFASVCVEYGDGHYNLLGANVPPHDGADIPLLEGWANLSWKDGMGIACPAPRR